MQIEPSEAFAREQDRRDELGLFRDLFYRRPDWIYLVERGLVP